MPSASVAVTVVTAVVFSGMLSVAVAPPLSEVSLPSSEPKRWPEIFAAAVANNDDHVIKMVYTCHRESARYGNPLYQAAAARLVAVGKTE